LPNSIGKDVGGIGDVKFACAGNPAWAAHRRILEEQIGGGKDPLHETVGRGWIVFRDVVGLGVG
jgi:hypothetical protein